MTLKHRIEPHVRRKQLKTLLDREGFARIIEAHNGLSGLVANEARLELADGTLKTFDGLWISSFTDSAAKGYPDTEVVSFDSRLATIEEVLFVTDKPLVVDGDTGMDAAQFEYTCARLEMIGVSAIVIEDKVFPKRNSLDAAARQTLEAPDVFATKIRRGKQVQMTDDFLIIARLESLIANQGVCDALERAEAYLRAGADGIMIHSKNEEPDEVFAFAADYERLCQRLGTHKPLVCVPTTYNQVTEETLKARGFNLVIYANHLLRAAHQAMQKACAVILENERSLETEAFCSPVSAVFDAVGFVDVRKKDEAYAHPAVRAIIPAAGHPGDELAQHFPGLPTCALPLRGKTVLQRQIETLSRAGVTENWVVTGFNAGAVENGAAHKIHNPDFERTHILDSVFRAAPQMDGGFVLAYADILFDDPIVQALLRRPEDMVLVVDCAYAQNRQLITKPKIELVTVKRSPPPHYRRLTSAGHEVKLIGARIDKDLATHEFVGLAYFSARGADILKKVYYDAREKYRGERFQEAECFENAALTDLLQEVLDRGFPIHTLEITQGWVEIQSFADYQHALEMVESC